MSYTFYIKQAQAVPSVIKNIIVSQNKDEEAKVYLANYTISNNDLINALKAKNFSIDNSHIRLLSSEEPSGVVYVGSDGYQPATRAFVRQVLNVINVVPLENFAELNYPGKNEGWPYDWWLNERGQEIGDAYPAWTSTDDMKTIIISEHNNGTLKYLSPLQDNGGLLPNSILKWTNQ